MVVASGCGQKPAAAPAAQEMVQNEDNSGTVNAAQPDDTVNSDTPKDSQTDKASNQADKPAKPDEKPEKAQEQTQKIEVYYTDPEQMVLKKSEKEIKFTSVIDKYKEAFKALQESGSSDLVPLWGKIELKSLEVKDGAMTIDIHMPDEARLGAGGEQYALDALTQTMFQFEEVQTVELLVDGQQEESLMGHVDLEHPFTRR
nr:GerMN domain-containing protein [Paenibacillus dendrobii]